MRRESAAATLCRTPHPQIVETDDIAHGGESGSDSSEPTMLAVSRDA
jgi:hypothetical protein